MVRRRVASATEGAAPNSPAKLLGLRTSPNTAKADTKRPPTINLMIVSVMLIQGRVLSACANLMGTEPGPHAADDRQHDAARDRTNDPRLWEFQTAHDCPVSRHTLRRRE